MPSLKAIFTRQSARLEASLSTHGFTILFLTMYVVSVVLEFAWGYYKECGDTVAYAWMKGLARGGGYVLNFNCALVLILASRLFITALRDTVVADVLPLDKAFPKLHIVVAYTIMAAVLIHVPFHFAWLGGWSKWEDGMWNSTMTTITGCALLFVFVVLFALSRPAVRKNHFRLFYFVHIFGASLFFVLLIFHGMMDGKPETYKYIVPALVIYLFDRLIRHFSKSNHDLNVTSENSSFKDENVLQLSIPKPFDFRPGQYAEIMVPSINREWHPFTIASANVEENMSFYIKNLGDWTDKLHRVFQARKYGDEGESLRVRVRGPFGAPTQEVNKYQRVFLIAGGIGSTPFASICKQLHHKHAEFGRPQYQQDRDVSLADTVEDRIRQAVAAVYDVDVKVLLNEGVKPRDGARMDKIATMMRVARASTFRGRVPQQAVAPQRTPSGADEERQKQDIMVRSVMTADDARFSFEDDDFAGDDFREVMSTAASSDDEESDEEDEVEMFKQDWADDHEPSSLKKFAERIVKPFNRKSHTKLNAPGVDNLSPAEKRERQQKAGLGQFRSALLSFLHTSRLTFALAVLCVARIAVVICGSIFKSDFVELGLNPVDGDAPKGAWVPLLYATLSVPLTLILTTAVLLEVSLLGARVLMSTRRLVEVAIFFPVSIAMTVLEFRRAVTNNPGGPVLVLLQYVAVQPLMFALVVGRMVRAVGKRGLVDEESDAAATDEELGHAHSKRQAPSKIPDLDFVWTTPRVDDDAWLCRELASVMDGKALRLHRYVTRATEEELLNNVGSSADLEQGQCEALQQATKAGRPNWEQLLATAARHTRSDGVIGIFLCGPHAMGKQVRETAQKIEMWSNLRDAYLRTTEVNALMQDLGLPDSTMVGRLRKYGCRVRFVYHEENFG